MFVVTPIAHVESPLKLTLDAFTSLYYDALAILREQLGQTRFISMKLNVGDFRNEPHLHLKVAVAPGDFEGCEAWRMFLAQTSGRNEAH